MGRRGPKPTPTSILRARGSWRAKTRSREPQPPRARPTCPRWLRPDAKRTWRALVPQLQAMGVLAGIDRNALAQYCTVFARWREAEEFLQKHGPIIVLRNKDGEMIRYIDRPEVDRAKGLLSLLQQIGSRFGLTPADRVALSMPSPKGRQQPASKNVSYINLGGGAG